MESQRTFNIVMIALFVISGMTATILNILLIHIVVKCKQKSKTKPLIINLCLCDLFISSIVVPLTLLPFIQLNISMDTGLCKTLNYSNNIIVFASVFTLAAISFQRWQGIRRTLHWQSSTADRSESMLKRLKMPIFVWILAAVCASPTAISSKVIEESFQVNESNASMTFTEKQCVYHWETLVLIFKDSATQNDIFATKLSYSMSMIVILYLIPIIITVHAYRKICRIVEKGIKELRKLSSGEGHSTGKVNNLTHSNKLFKLSVLMVIIFTVFWLPFHLLNLIFDIMSRYQQDFTENMNSVLMLLKDIYCFFTWLALTNSAANPLFLLIADTTYRKQLVDKICCHSDDGHRPLQIQSTTDNTDPCVARVSTSAV